MRSVGVLDIGMGNDVILEIRMRGSVMNGWKRGCMVGRMMGGMVGGMVGSVV